MKQKGLWQKSMAFVLAAALLLSVAMPMQAEAAWRQGSNGWWWQRDNGSYPTSSWQQIYGKWYYFDSQGWMCTGWQKIGGNWYYLGAANDGSMKTGWQQIGSNWYYFYSSGAMAANTWIGNYYVNASGAWVQQSTTAQWISSGGRWWYRHKDGSYTKNAWEQIYGNWYYFDSQGWMCTGWQYIGGSWYYLGAANDGAMKTGWQNVNGYWYYLYSNGIMAANTWIGNYYVDASGRWVSTKSDYTVDLGDGKTTTVNGFYDASYEEQVVALVNEYRVANGRNPLTVLPVMETGVDIRGYEIAYLTEHTRPNGTSCFTVLEGNGFIKWGENIAAGQLTPEAVMETWKNSPGHNANMLNPNWKYIGVSCFQSNTGIYGIYWVQLFAA